jgi:general secretion pathway protein D
MLCFVVVILGCAGKKAQLKTESGGASTQQVSNPKEEIAVPATSQRAPATPAAAQPPAPSQRSKSAEAQMVTSPPTPSAQPVVPTAPQPPTPVAVEPLSPVQASKSAGAQPLAPSPTPPTQPSLPATSQLAAQAGIQPGAPSRSPKSEQAQAPTSPATPSAQPAVPATPKAPSPAGVQPSAPSQPSAPPVARPATPPIGPGVIFNFDNADIYEVIRVMTEILRINYLIDPRVKGTVNIHTTGQLPAEEVFPIFQSILRLNGATAVKKDGLYEIVPLSDAKKTYVSPTTIRGGTKLPLEEKYTIQIVSLKYIPATEASKLIKPFLSDGADIVEHPPHNILIISDVASNIKKSLDILALFDIDIFTSMRVRIYPILNADVTEVAKEMERIFSSFEVSTKSARGVGITFTPITRINSLLVISSIPNIFEKVEGWLKELDKIPGEGSKLSVFVYYVQNAKAKDLAEVLKEVFVKAKEKKTEKAVTPAEATPRGARPAPAPAPPPTPAKEEAGGVPEGEINIVVDETTNSLIIKAFHRDYRAILETVKKLDIYPKQVLIETLLAEITLDDTNKLGVEWAQFFKGGEAQQRFSFGTTPSTGTTTMSLADAAAALPGAGTFRYSIEIGRRLSAAISAAATENRLKIISSPHILASNNKEAKIQVGSSQPILTNTYTTPGVTSTTGSGVVEGTIEYKDIGIILTITPRVSDGGLITLELQIEKSDVNAKALPLGNLQNVPVFTKKTAKTILSVLEGQTVVIGGLIEDSKNVTKSGIPLLSKIPLLGALFGFQTYEKIRTELILLLTPHIITDQITSDAVTREFKEKVEGIRKQLEEKEKKEKERKEKREK